MRQLTITSEFPNGLSPKGQQTVINILETARNLFIEEGYSAFSINRVSEETGLARGNITYYFPNRKALLQTLLQAVIAGYMDIFDEIVENPQQSATEKLEAIMRLILTDMGTKETSRFFPELWALAGHNEDAATEMQKLYESARKHMNMLIAEINPAFTVQQREDLALFISAAMEGQTPFIGYGRTYQARLESVTDIAVQILMAAICKSK